MRYEIVFCRFCPVQIYTNFSKDRVAPNVHKIHEKLPQLSCEVQTLGEILSDFHKFWIKHAFLTAIQAIRFGNWSFKYYVRSNFHSKLKPFFQFQNLMSECTRKLNCHHVWCISRSFFRSNNIQTRRHWISTSWRYNLPSLSLLEVAENQRSTFLMKCFCPSNHS